MVSKAYHLKDSASFVEKALHWAAEFDSVCFLNSNGYRDNYGNINVFIAVGEQDCFVAENNKIDKFGEKPETESNPFSAGESTQDLTSNQTFSISKPMDSWIFRLRPEERIRRLTNASPQSHGAS
jgi:hypothetical protein